MILMTAKKYRIKYLLICFITFFSSTISIAPANAFDVSYYPVSTNTDYFITTTAGDTIIADTTLDPGGDPYLWLFGPSDDVNAVTYNDDSGVNGAAYNSYISYLVPTTGTYRLRAGRCCTYNGAFSGTVYRLRVRASGSISSTSTDTTPPTISSIAVTSSAGSDSTYTAGETISLSLTWSENAIVTGTPRIPIQGLTSKYLTYASGSGTTSLVFSYTVVSGDNDTDGIAISANTLELNGGTIKDAAGNVATLTHLAVAASTSHKVDTTVPTHSSSAVNSAGTTVTMTYSEALSSTTAAASTFTVVAAGSAVTVSSVSISGSTVVLNLGSTIRISQTVTVAYTDPTAGNDASAVQDVGGNDAASLSATSVTNNSTVKQTQATFTLTSGSTTYGTAFRLVTSGGSGTGAVSYSVSSGACSIANTDSVTASSAGNCVVVATKATDTTYAAAYDTQTIIINKANQAKLSLGQYTAFVGISTYPLNVYGGSGTGSLTRTLAAPGSANCTLQSGMFVQATLTGSCSITVVKAGDANYLAETTTASIYWVAWSDAYATRVPYAPTEIVLQHKTQITKYNYDTLTVTSYKDGFGNPVTAISRNSQIRIIGDGFNSSDTTTEVVFGNAEIVDSLYSSPALQVISDGSGGFYILVTVPSGATSDYVTVNSAKGTARGPMLTIL
jgi:uncharacterized repeat protein (TIGR02059 family)